MDLTNGNTALASAFVEELARCGLRRAVISPGSRSTPLALALWRQPAIDCAVIVDERSAAFFALGAAQAAGEPVAILCTSGTAAANYHPAVCEADESALPLIVLTADRPPELRGIGAGQTIDQLKLYGAAVRWFCEVGTQEANDAGLHHVRSTACRAFAAASGPWPGPVHLNLPWREPLAPVPVEGAVTAGDPLALEGRGEEPLTTVAGLDHEPGDAVLDELARRVEAAEAPLIVAGRQLDLGLRDSLARLAAAIGAPILAEPTSQLRCGAHDRSQVVSTYDLLLRDWGFAERMRPDLVLRFGDMPTSKPLRGWLEACGAPEVAVHPLGSWNAPTRGAASIVRASATPTAAGLAERIARGESRDAALWRDCEAAALGALASELDGASTPSEPALHWALGGAHRNGDLVYTASSMPIRDQEAYLPPSSADALFLCNRGANGIDGLLSSGIGAAAASGRPTTVVTGDLGLLHDIGGLAALREVRTPVRIVVVDNDGGGIFHFLPQSRLLDEEQFEALFGTPRGVSVERAAALFELPHRRLDSLSDLPSTLDSGTCLVEVPVDRRETVELHRRLQAAVSASLTALL